MKTDLITRNRQVLGGTPVFAETRVPIRTLIDHLAAGDPLEVFLDNFPGVSREQAVQFLREAEEALLAQTHETAS